MPRLRFSHLLVGNGLAVETDWGQIMTKVHELRETWLRERWQQGEINGRTRTLLGCRFREFEAAHGDRPISELDRRTVNRWRTLIGTNSPATRRAYLSTVRGFCTWLVAEGYLEVDPTAHVGPIKEPRRVPRARPEGDIARLLAFAHDKREQAIIWLMVGMGLRCIEVARLETADYDRLAGTLLIRGKASHERMLPVPSTVVDAVQVYRDQIGWRVGPLILSSGSLRTGITGRRVSQIVTRVMKEAGVKVQAHDGISPHALRHTAASDVLDRCDNVRTVQIMLGHASLATTQIYLRRSSLGQLREAMEGRTYSGKEPLDEHAAET